jgi:hypothetical protein
VVRVVIPVAAGSKVLVGGPLYCATRKPSLPPPRRPEPDPLARRSASAWRRSSTLSTAAWARTCLDLLAKGSNGRQIGLGPRVKRSNRCL